MHRGFYAAYHNTTLRDGVVSGIQKTREAYGDIPIMITGHSMGGAMASFCALDLVVSTEPCPEHMLFKLLFILQKFMLGGNICRR